MNGGGPSLFDGLEDTLRVREYKALVDAGTHCPNPAVEDLHDIYSSLDLCNEIIRDHIHQLVHQCIPHCWLPIHQRFSDSIITRWASFDHIASEGIWCTRKADDGLFTL